MAFRFPLGILPLCSFGNPANGFIRFQFLSQKNKQKQTITLIPTAKERFYKTHDENIRSRGESGGSLARIATRRRLPRAPADAGFTFLRGEGGVCAALTSGDTAAAHLFLSVSEGNFTIFSWLAEAQRS